MKLFKFIETHKAMLALVFSGIGGFVYLIAGPALDLYDRYSRVEPRPLLTTSFYYDSEKTGWKYALSGKGDAIVKWAEVRYKDKPIRYWEDIGDSVITINKRRKEDVLYSSLPPQPGLAKEGSTGWFFDTRNVDLANHLMSVAKYVEIRMCYCTLSGECWITSRVPWEKEVDDCSKVEHLTFIGPRGENVFPPNYYD